MVKRSAAITVFLACALAVPSALFARGMEHPRLDINRTTIEPQHIEAVNVSLDSFNISPVSVTPVESDSRFSDDNRFESPVHELNFDNRTSFQHLEFNQDDSNRHFSNVRLEFEDPQFKHLNINVQ